MTILEHNYYDFMPENCSSLNVLGGRWPNAFVVVRMPLDYSDIGFPLDKFFPKFVRHNNGLICEHS